jgi:hypothetical protein
MEYSFDPLGIKITEDPTFTGKLYGVNNNIIGKFQDIRDKIENKKDKKIIGELINLIDEYPEVPMLKNYLATAYTLRKMDKESKEIVLQTVVEHPDYLFGKLALANLYIDEKNYSKVPDILGNEMDIIKLYPDRKTFHASEVINFYKVAVRYFAAVKDLENARDRLNILTELAPEDLATQQAFQFVLPLTMEEMMKSNLIRKERKELLPKSKKVEITDFNEPPVFNHPEIEWLYVNDIKIPHQKLREILSLPRETLISDLEKVLLDAELRYAYLSESKEETHSWFALHAIFLLKELKAVESLPKVLAFLENDEEFLEIWLRDHLTSTVWQAIYELAISQIQLLADFLKIPSVYTFSKCAISEALCQIVLHQPEKKKEVEAVYADVFNFYANDDLDKNFVDYEFLGLAIGDCIDCGLKNLLPLISILHEKDLVDTSINGSFEDVEEYFRNPHKHNTKHKVLDIFRLYNEVLTTWAGYKEDKNTIKQLPRRDMQPPLQQAVSNKVGRNDPCPCGSGLKYKKCCGN